MELGVRARAMPWMHCGLWSEMAARVCTTHAGATVERLAIVRSARQRCEILSIRGRARAERIGWNAAGRFIDSLVCVTLL